MAEPARDPSVEHEPHLRPVPPQPIAGDPRLPYALPSTPGEGDQRLRESVLQEPGLSAELLGYTPVGAASSRPADEAVEHTVWEEPGVSTALAGGPRVHETYGHWLEEKQRGMSAGRSWGLALLIALAAGPFGVMGAFMGSEGSISGIVMLVAIGPLTEELVKVALPLWVAEKRPYVFRGAEQIVVCALAGGLAFAALENLIYLYVYIPDPSPGLVRWRWTVCVGLHTGCSMVAGLGVLRVWSQAVRRKVRPQATASLPLLIAAAVIHGTYNALALMIEVLKVPL